MSAIGLKKELVAYFQSDENWCSDFEAKHGFVQEVLGDEAYRDITSRFSKAFDETRFGEAESDRFDSLLKTWLDALPDIIRYIVERRSGLWVGGALPGNADSLGEELDLSSTFVEACYREGISLLRKTIPPALQGGGSATQR